MCAPHGQGSAGGCRRTVCGELCEGCLPAPVREALRLTRTSHPDREITCVAFSSEEDGRETVRLCPAWRDDLHAREVIVLSVAVTETTMDRVRTWSHRLVAHAARRTAAPPRPIGLA